MKNDNIYGYVYLITNLVNDKQYVGQTVETIEEAKEFLFKTTIRM